MTTQRTKDELERSFVCPKCRGHGGSVRAVALPAGGAIPIVLPVAAATFAAVSCILCGYTEFYNLNVHVPAGEAEGRARKAALEAEAP